jgi:hypothetical protein
MKKIGITMGVLLMTGTPGLELQDVVDDDYCMEKINQALVRYIIDSYANTETYIAGQKMDVVHLSYEDIEKLNA